MCNDKCNKGWSWNMEYNPTKLLNDWTFNVLFDDKIISTRFLYEPPTTEEAEEYLNETRKAMII